MTDTTNLDIALEQTQYACLFCLDQGGNPEGLIDFVQEIVRLWKVGELRGE